MTGFPGAQSVQKLRALYSQGVITPGELGNQLWDLIPAECLEEFIRQLPPECIEILEEMTERCPKTDDEWAICIGGFGAGTFTRNRERDPEVEKAEEELRRRTDRMKCEALRTYFATVTKNNT